ncbi:FkbM family methyltransferase [Roseibium aggregatum]|uniref:FkbM family methyltransferase n=1 Tax=Roseibium aggregatum TaxID=187304 RepID=A0A926SAP3_9HYPH|nr:FkbM family methyltransferase [Roseibium aggregatum]MBD1549624.1 FkbM family methyltransferase [Roseibium aggregatum]
MKSYAKNFEDLILMRSFENISSGYYIDIGAFDPFEDSVSRAFYELGWRGLHVEPNSDYASKLRHARPDEEVLQVAVGEGEGDIPFYEIPGTGMSTAIEDIALMHKARGFDYTSRTVPVVPLKTVLEHADRESIDWMKINVEGMEASVLSSWGDASQRPGILVIDSVSPDAREETHQEWEEEVLSRGYLLAYFDGLNRFYVHESKKNFSRNFRLGPICSDNYGLPEGSKGFLVREMNQTPHQETFSDENKQLLQNHHGLDVSYHNLHKMHYDLHDNVLKTPAERDAALKLLQETEDLTNRINRNAARKWIKRIQRQALPAVGRPDGTATAPLHSALVRILKNSINQERQTRRLIARLELNPAEKAFAFDANYYTNTYRLTNRGQEAAFRDFIKIGMSENRSPNFWFDPEWYAKHYVDFASAGIPAFTHYFLFGIGENRQPNFWFNPNWYAGQYPDAVSGGISATKHFFKIGRFQGRSPNFWFDPTWYGEHYLGAEHDLSDPVEHYFTHGIREWHKPNPWFNPEWYAAQNPEIIEEGWNPVEHYFSKGIYEWRRPNFWFDPIWYSIQFRELREGGILPLEYFILFGSDLAHSPSQWFDTRDYLLKYGVNLEPTTLGAIQHYLDIGEKKCFRPTSWFDPAYYSQSMGAVKLEPDTSFLQHYLESDRNSTHFANAQAEALIKSDAPPSGVMVVGYHEASLGLGTSCRKLTDAIRDAGVNTAALPFRLGVEDRLSSRLLPDPAHGLLRDHIYVLPAPHFCDALTLTQKRAYPARWNILRTYWELANIPEDWRQALLAADQIWVASNFIQSAILRLDKTLVVKKIPSVVQIPEAEMIVRPERNRPFNFFFSFDYNSSPHRKNPKAIIQNFQKAFAPEERDVGLIIKSNGYSDRHGPYREEMMRLSSKDARIKHLEGYVSEKTLQNMHEEADCFISLHRSEGFGLGLAEFLASAKPVIATDYGGSTDFITAETAHPISYQLVPVKKEEYVHFEGQFWAEPDEEHAISAMREVFQNQEGSYRRALNGRALIEHTCSPQVVSALCLQALGQ